MVIAERGVSLKRHPFFMSHKLDINGLIPIICMNFTLVLLQECNIFTLVLLQTFATILI